VNGNITVVYIIFSLDFGSRGTCVQNNVLREAELTGLLRSTWEWNV